jgi:hypothetical protein
MFEWFDRVGADADIAALLGIFRRSAGTVLQTGRAVLTGAFLNGHLLSPDIARDQPRALIALLRTLPPVCRIGRCPASGPIRRLVCRLSDARSIRAFQSGTTALGRSNAERGDYAPAGAQEICARAFRSDAAGLTRAPSMALPFRNSAPARSPQSSWRSQSSLCS